MSGSDEFASAVTTTALADNAAVRRAPPSTCALERQESRRPTLPLCPGDAALWRRRRPTGPVSSTVSQVHASCKHKRSSVHADDETAGAGAKRPCRAQPYRGEPRTRSSHEITVAHRCGGRRDRPLGCRMLPGESSYRAAARSEEAIQLVRRPSDVGPSAPRAAPPSPSPAAEPAGQRSPA